MTKLPTCTKLGSRFLSIFDESKDSQNVENGMVWSK